MGKHIRNSGLTAYLLIALAMFVAACDEDTTTAPLEPIDSTAIKDSLRLRDSLRIVDSIRAADSLLRLQDSAALAARVQAPVRGYSHLEIRNGDTSVSAGHSRDCFARLHSNDWLRITTTVRFNLLGVKQVGRVELQDPHNNLYGDYLVNGEWYRTVSGHITITKLDFPGFALSAYYDARMVPLNDPARDTIRVVGSVNDLELLSDEKIKAGHLEYQGGWYADGESSLSHRDHEGFHLTAERPDIRPGCRGVNDYLRLSFIVNLPQDVTIGTLSQSATSNWKHHTSVSVSHPRCGDSYSYDTDASQSDVIHISSVDLASRLINGWFTFNGDTVNIVNMTWKQDF